MQLPFRAPQKKGGHEAKKIAQLCAEKGGPMKPKKNKAKLCGKKVAPCNFRLGRRPQEKIFRSLQTKELTRTTTCVVEP